MSKKFRKDVGALGLNSLVNVLKTDYSDTEIISYVLDTHVGVSRLMDVLSETREVLRNDALILLFKL